MPPPWRRCVPARWRVRCRARRSWSKPVIPRRSRVSRPREPFWCGRSAAARKATGMSSHPPLHRSPVRSPVSRGTRCHPSPHSASSPPSPRPTARRRPRSRPGCRGTARRRGRAHHDARPAAGHAAVRCRGSGPAVAAAGRVPLRGRGGAGARPGRGRHVLGRMAPGARRGRGATGYGGGAARRRRAARPLVAVRGGHRRFRRRVGVAAAPGTAMTTPGSGKRETGNVSLWRRLVQAVRRSSDANATEAERILLEADFGVEATAQILAAVSGATDGEFRAAVERAVTAALVAAAPGDPGALARAPTPPTVILVFGVNGVGKTTTVAKLAARLARDGRSVLLAAADTFRAGATEQLQAWAGRLGVHAVTGTGDPAAVAFDAIAAARARGSDTVLVDTAGRLHTEDRLLEELKKVVRVVAKQQPGAPHESLLVLDGTVGQSAVHQARAFAAAVPLTGLIVTKLDGTAKGGSVVALQRAVPVPVRFLGTGEALEDLEVFDAARYARRLVDAS